MQFLSLRMPCAVDVLYLVLICILICAFCCILDGCFVFNPTYEYVLYDFMLPMGQVPAHIYVNKTCISHYNLPIVYVYLVEYIFFYIL